MNHRRIEEEGNFGLFMNNVNKNGPNIDPCGTRIGIIYFIDIFSGSLTDWVLSLN